MDIVDKNTRSRMMSGIGPKNTRPERLLRSALHRRGFRFTLHPSGMPGRPDIVLPKHRAALFVHGCFWHRHAHCPYCSTPASNTEFWAAKFAANVARDVRKAEALTAAGWRVGVVWECQLRTSAAAEMAADRLAGWLTGSKKSLELPPAGRRPGRPASE